MERGAGGRKTGGLAGRTQGTVTLSSRTEVTVPVSAGKQQLILLVEGTLEAGGVQEQAGGPGRCLGHDAAGILDLYIGVGLQDDLIMDMHDGREAVVVQTDNGLGEEITGDGLDDVLAELRAVGIGPLPLSAGAAAVIGELVAAKVTLDNAGARVGKTPPGGKTDEQEAGLIGEEQAFQLDRLLLPEAGQGSPVDLPPEGDDGRI